MADSAFEMELDRSFAEAPILPDSERFASRVCERLDRGWTFRRFVIGGLGLAGGLVGGGQLLSSGLLVRASGFGSQVDRFMKPGAIEIPAVRGFGDLLSATLSVDGQVLWMAGILAALAAGLLVTRAIRDF